MSKMVHDLEHVEEYLKAVLIPLRLSCMTQSGWPMIVSLWFFYQEKKLYCATQLSAKVVGYLKNNPRFIYMVLKLMLTPPNSLLT